MMCKAPAMWQGGSRRSNPGTMNGNKAFVEQLIALVVDLCLKVAKDRWEVWKQAPALCEIAALSANSVVTSEEVDEIVVYFSFRCVPMNWHFDPSEGNLRDSACMFIDIHVLTDILSIGLAQVDRIRARSSHGHKRRRQPSPYGDSAGRWEGYVKRWLRSGKHVMIVWWSKWSKWCDN